MQHAVDPLDIAIVPSPMQPAIFPDVSPVEFGRAADPHEDLFGLFVDLAH
jgi:hypothetical protein